MKNLIRGICLLLALSVLRLSHAHGVSEEMAEAANAFLAALSPQQRNQATFELKNEERFNWHFIPRERKGLSLKEMTPAQRALAHGLLSSGLSHRGYFKANAIISLEQILQDIEQGRGPKRDSELYFFSIFGTPESHGAWGWRVEGHHLALNFTIAGHHVSAAPSFLGTNPAEVREGPRKGLRVLGAEEDLARTLINSLDGEQRKTAIFANSAPADIITGADRKARVLEPKGIAMSALNPAQQRLLLALIREYLFRARSEIAEKQFVEIQKAPGQIYFAWAGPTEVGQAHYYRVQGPGFLMEYDNIQNNANHVHAVWRDLKNDFGEDMLRKHYDEHHRK